MPDLRAALAGPITEWAHGVRAQGGLPELGLYLSAEVAQSTFATGSELGSALSDVDVHIWTANAFPFGGFHSDQVKENAFLPDWSSKSRVTFTQQVAQTLTRFLGPKGVGSVSTCPLGYRKDLLTQAAVVENLRAMQAWLRSLAAKTDARVILALEPEPDACFERVQDLATWLDSEVLQDVPVSERQVGVCWDLCHSQVVGESSEEVLNALSDNGIPLGKVQVSSALRWKGPLSTGAHQQLKQLASDPWFHQVRGTSTAGMPLAFADLPEYLADEKHLATTAEGKIHCHVPVHQKDYGGGLEGTGWRHSLGAAWEWGCRDFEVETYTLPILPAEWLEAEGVVGTLVAEWCAVQEELAARA